MEPNSTKSLLLFFKQKWEERYDSNQSQTRAKFQIVWGRDGAIAKRLLATYSIDELRLYCTYYLSDYRNDYCTRAALPFRLFSSSINEIAALVHEAEQAKRATTSAASDYERIAQARRERA